MAEPFPLGKLLPEPFPSPPKGGDVGTVPGTTTGTAGNDWERLVHPMEEPVSLPDIAALGDPDLQALKAGVEAELLRRAVLLAVAEHERTRAKEIPEHLSAEQTAQLIGRSTSWVFHNWRTALPFGFRDGGRLRFPAEQVKSYLRRLPRGGRARARIAS